MRRFASVLLVACAIVASAPAAAQSNCVAGFASGAGGMPPFIGDLMAGFGRFFGYIVRYNCDVPEEYANALTAPERSGAV